MYFLVRLNGNVQCARVSIVSTSARGNVFVSETSEMKNLEYLGGYNAHEYEVCLSMAPLVHGSL